MESEHVVVDDDPPCSHVRVCRMTDLTGNGRPNVVIGALGGESSVSIPAIGEGNFQSIFGPSALAKRVETNILWYENPRQERHDFGEAYTEHQADARLGGR